MKHPQQLAAFRIVETVSPAAAAAIAEKMWFTPPRPSGGRQPLPATVSPVSVAVSVKTGDRVLSGFRIGDGPAVLAIHGWGGYAGQYLPLGLALDAAGSSLVSVDFPAHGQDPIRRTNVFEMAEVVRRTIEDHGPFDLVVAHSLGAMALSMAMGGVATPAVFVAPVLSVDTAIAKFSEQLSLKNATTVSLTRRIRTFIGEDAWPRMSIGGNLVWDDALTIYPAAWPAGRCC